MAADEDIPLEHRVRKIRAERQTWIPECIVPSDPIHVVEDDVVPKGEPHMRRGSRGQNVPSLEARVVLDDDIGCTVEKLEEPPRAAPPGTAHVLEQVVLNQNPPGGLARVDVIAAEDVDPRGGVAHDVVHKCHVFHDRPRRATVLITHGEEDGEAGLSVDPVVLENIPVREDTPGVLEFKEIFHHPRRSGILGLADLPGQWLEKVVTPDLDVSWHEARDRGIGAAKDDILPRRCQVVIHDLERTWSVPTSDGLSVRASLVKI